MLASDSARSALPMISQADDLTNGVGDMSTRVTRDAGHRLYSKRRIFLLASVTALSGGLLFADFALSPHTSGRALFAPPPAHAQNAQPPVGFAGLVEQVKPSVISVKVKMNTGGDSFTLNDDNPLRGTPFEDFFRSEEHTLNSSHQIISYPVFCLKKNRPNHDAPPPPPPHPTHLRPSPP